MEVFNVFIDKFGFIKKNSLMLIYQYLQKRGLIPYEDGNVKEEQGVNVFDDEQQQALSSIPQLELPLVKFEEISMILFSYK
ncbi:hypothetical protein GIB67_040486 [Kingdonia uniflora]|uniref:Uncharacterized protein n=1 Tax=Kingdonia uniflora TaxID=39325 RepID=A0A7J7L5E0_9MAGN|nr:hypothetical protein GIB67_040486 [Kingdonia uniflora]